MTVPRSTLTLTIVIFYVLTLTKCQGNLIRSITGHTDAVNSVAFSADGTKLASGSDDYTVQLWNVATGESIKTMPEHTYRVESVAFSGTKVASGSENETIILWDIVSGATTQFDWHPGQVRSVAFSKDGTRLASGSADKSIRYYGVPAGNLIRRMRENSNSMYGSNPNGHTGSVNSVAISPDGTKLASGSSDDSIMLWDMTLSLAYRNLLKRMTGHTRGVNSVAFSPDGSALASGSTDKTIKLWNIPTGGLITTIERQSAVYSVAFSPDGAKLASGATDNNIKLHKFPSGEEIDTFEGHTDFVLSVAFSPDGKTIASGSKDDTIKLWDVEGSEIDSDVFIGGAALASFSSFIASMCLANAILLTLTL